MSTVRVGFIIDSLRPGAGTENQLILLLRSFDRGRITPFVCCLRNESSVSNAEIHCPIRFLDASKKIASLGGLRSIAAARSWVRANCLQLVITFFRDANIVGTLGARWAGVPVVSSRRNLGKGYWHTPSELRLLRFLNHLTYWHVTNSSAVREYTAQEERVDPRRIEVLPNAIDLGIYYPRGEESREQLRYRLGLPDGFLIGCVANLRPIKGVDVLLRAFGGSDLLRKKCHLVLVGSGTEEPALRSLAREFEMEDRVHFLGARTDVQDILRVLDVAALSSHGESSPNAVLEYMASALPVVATAVGGVSELLQAGKGGIVVASGKPEELRKALEALFHSPQMRTDLGQVARRYVEMSFARDQVVERWTRFIEESVKRLRQTSSM